MALFLFFLLSVTSAAAALSDPVPDRSALLRFKSSLLSAPPGWSGPDHCLWPGVTCAAARDPRVVALNLSAGSSEPGPFRSDPTRQPSGNLTAALAALSGLRTLETVDLSGCSLSGQLPSRFPPRLRVLNLAANLITGEIPESLFSSLPRLRALFLSLNRLGGNIPAKIGSFCQNLENLDLSGNLLVGGIPTSLGNCGQLTSLLLFSNLLDGNIPSELGSLKKLSVLDVSRNSLSGTVPPELGNCSELSVLVLLNFFDLMPAGDSLVDNDEFNYFQGGLSEKITSLPKLRVLWAPRAMFEGEFPGNWGGCGSLEMVNLGHNLFTGGIPAALGRCENLRFLNLSSNNLTGWLSGELNVPCMDLFDVSGNKLSGSIPSFGNSQCNSYALPSDGLPSAYYRFFVYRTRKGVVWPSFVSGADYAVYHDFGRNEFEGALPALLVSGDRYGNQAVYAFLADGNRLSGPLTVNQFAKCNGLNGLIANFSNNLISGGLPADIGVMCRNLMVLDVAGNRVSGVIPQSVGLLHSLVVIDLSMNRLQGQIPVGFGELKGLKYLSLASNNLSGQIPSSLNQLHSLEVLDLSSNYLTGDIPGELVRLRNLTILQLNDNKLSGELPSGLANVTSLSMFNVSFNNLSGPLPTNAGMLKCDSVLGNPLLQSCHVFSLSIPPAYVQGRSGDVQAYTDTPPGGSVTKSGSSGFSSIEIASITSASAIVSVLFALIFLYIYTRKCARRPAQTGRKEVKIFVDIGVPLTYECVVQATGNFMASNCIGSGGFGATYKAEVSPGVLVAIKRLSVGRIQGAQQFHAEIKTLGRWRHPNLVTLIGYHIGDSEMFLVYNYLPGGNLERFIQERSKRAINWSMLHKIALDIARALAYLHDHCVPRILHRDVKPSNILLDNDFNAYLSDFGLARLLGNSETHATTGVAGTFGYVAPEYAMTCRVSDKADVYSYGVVLLELLSDKKALDPSFSPYGNGFNIVAWACMLLKQGKARDFFTEGLWDAAPHDDLVETLHLAVKCTVESLTIRPTMKQVVRRLRELQPPS